MTATAEIVTSERRNVLLLPNAALRFSPGAANAASNQGGGVTSVLIPQRPRGTASRNRDVTIGRGSTQTVYVLGQDGEPEPVPVTTGDTNGMQIEVTGKGLKQGVLVITGQLATDAAAGANGSKASRGR
jgi:HlyD family secretion protein